MRLPKIRLSGIVKALNLILAVTGVIRTGQGKPPAPWQEVGGVIRDAAQAEEERRRGSQQ